MATNAKLRTALLAKLGGVTSQALSARVQKKKQLAPMSTELATYLIAHEEGLKIDKYLPPATVQQVRELINHTRPPATNLATPSKARSSRGANKAREIRFPTGLRLPQMFLPAGKLGEALDMAKVYPLLYVLENSMREIIRRTMAGHYRDDWWDTKLLSGKVKPVHAKAVDRMKNERKYHQRRGAHPIDYVDLADLGTIISSNSGIFFRSVLDCEVDWFRSTFMDDLEQSRNVVGHMNPLDPNNIKDLEVKVERWSKLLKHSAGSAPIPSA
jgi:hypothetical protein